MTAHPFTTISPSEAERIAGKGRRAGRESLDASRSRTDAQRPRVRPVSTGAVNLTAEEERQMIIDERHESATVQKHFGRFWG